MSEQPSVIALGYDGQPVRFDQTTSDRPGNRLTVLVPGYGYTVEMPIFYYLEQAALEAGSSVVRLLTSYSRLPAFTDADDATRARWLAHDLGAVISAVRAQAAFDAVTVIGKSIGTIAMAGLDRSVLEATESPRMVWLTPLLRDPAVIAAIRVPARRSLVVIGTADPHYDPALVHDLTAQSHLSVSVHGGADHSLDHPGDISRSIETLGAVVADVQSFGFPGH